MYLFQFYKNIKNCLDLWNKCYYIKVLILVIGSLKNVSKTINAIKFLENMSIHWMITMNSELIFGSYVCFWMANNLPLII